MFIATKEDTSVYHIFIMFVLCLSPQDLLPSCLAIANTGSTTYLTLVRAMQLLLAMPLTTLDEGHPLLPNVTRHGRALQHFISSATMTLSNLAE